MMWLDGSVLIVTRDEEGRELVEDFAEPVDNDILYP